MRLCFALDKKGAGVPRIMLLCGKPRLASGSRKANAPPHEFLLYIEDRAGTQGSAEPEMVTTLLFLIAYSRSKVTDHLVQEGGI